MEADMAARKKAKTDATKKGDARGPADVPSLFRINVEVGDLDEAAKFYGKLFGLVGRKQAGSRCYFTCGSVTLQVVDASSVRAPHPAAKALYFVVNDLDAVFKRARSLGCLSQGEVHGSPGGEISVQPWGERSFYAEDPWHNPLCFVEAGTIYPG
jgi:predicted enzyme related to lactoylglutathione lyase